MTVKNEYGNALFILAKEEGATENVKNDIETAFAAIKENPEYVKLLDTPAVSKAEKLALIDEAFSAIHYSVKNLLKILSEKHAVYSFGSVKAEYDRLYDELYGIERVEAITVVPLSDSQSAALEKKLAEMTGKRIILKNSVKPDILGGVILRYSGTQLDGSVKARLQAFASGLQNLNL
jgi:F-type H+-transporting ATPase subunit delta